MITELEYECRRKGHGKLHQLEVDGLFYTYCPKCVKKSQFHKSYYDFLGNTRMNSLRAYMESEGYKKRNGECYKADWEGMKSTEEYTSMSTMKLMKSIRN